MGWRTIVITGITKLDYSMDYIVVRKTTGTRRIHLSEVGTVIVESTTVSLTTALLAELIKNKIKVIFCDEKHNPSSELQPYYGCHDASLKIKEQIAWHETIKMDVATRIITDKIRKQRDYLIELKYDEEAGLLDSYVSSMTAGDKTNREGHAAKVYFNALFGKDFTRGADNSINAALNYGYDILLASFNREVVANGYLTQLGLFHDNIFNLFNFSSDLMEPYRVLVDRMVVELKPIKFETEERTFMRDLYNLQISIDGYNRFLTDAISVYCRSVFEALYQEDDSLIKCYSNEL